MLKPAFAIFSIVASCKLPLGKPKRNVRCFSVILRFQPDCGLKCGASIVQEPQSASAEPFRFFHFAIRRLCARNFEKENQAQFISMVGKAYDDILTAALLQSAKHPIQVRSIHLHHRSEEWFSLHQGRKVVQERDDLARVMDHSTCRGARAGMIEMPSNCRQKEVQVLFSGAEKFLERPRSEMFLSEPLVTQNSVIGLGSAVSFPGLV